MTNKQEKCPECQFEESHSQQCSQYKVATNTAEKPTTDTNDWRGEILGWLCTNLTEDAKLQKIMEIVERAREEGKLKGIKIGNATEAGYKRGLEAGRTAGLAERHPIGVEALYGFEAGRTAAFAEVREIAEEMKIMCADTHSSIARNNVLNDFLLALEEKK